ncbi:LysR family transcriptional regulator [Paracidovorax anthurii]|uniref:DNA-binding transcriptional LysR family regulator n=1 Tax=Paracidovorax anthurii TaxID=78229 RepID=A0A328ZWD2_9BURK|nr:LysR family transcriptional regulator [Paracidovorax anthurii]RAR86546.1 DNA-binding transcriptional LysR family regulator [Paracidovorax anthurii]
MEPSGLELTGLRVFLAIVEAGSFSAAADRLGMAPPMVSKHIARLERVLGARLLHRTSRSMSLTEAGTAFCAQGRQALELLDAAAAMAGQGQDRPRGELRISAPVWCATPRFAGLLAAYRRAFPEVRLDLHLDNHMVDIVSEGFDVALRMTAEPAPQLIARPLCPVAFHLVAAPGALPLPGGGPLGAPPPIPVVVPNYVPFERFRGMLQDGLRQPIDTVMKSSDSTLSYHAVIAGMGAAFLPDWLVEGDLASGRLVKLPGAADFAGTLFAVYASRRHMPPKLRSFIDFLAERLGGAGPPRGAP